MNIRLAAKWLNYISHIKKNMEKKRIIVSVFFFLFLFSITSIFIINEVEAQNKYHWKTLPEMPTPRTEVTSAIIGNEIYVIGGFEEGRITSNVVEIFNVMNNTWRIGYPLPVPLHHAVAIGFEENIYVFGGYTDGWIAVDTTYIFNTKDEVWKKGQNMPRVKAAFTAQVINKKIFTIGGASTIFEDGRRVEVVLGINEYFDLETGIWQEVMSMPTPREHLASAKIDGKIFVFGGRSLTLNSNTDITEVYDSFSNTWSQKASMNLKRGGIAGASINEKVFVFGGETNERTFHETEEYNPEKNKWQFIESMPTARHGLTAASISGKIFVIGGGPQPGYTYSNTNEALEFQITTISTSIPDEDISNNNILYFLFFGIGIVILVSVLFYFNRR